MPTIKLARKGMKLVQNIKLWYNKSWEKVLKRRRIKNLRYVSLIF